MRRHALSKCTSSAPKRLAPRSVFPSMAMPSSQVLALVFGAPEVGRSQAVEHRLDLLDIDHAGAGDGGWAGSVGG